MKIVLPKIYPITDRAISGLSHVEQLIALAEGGATLVQLREKRASSLEFYNEARLAVAAGHDRDIRVLLNDRVDIELLLRADGVHLGQDDLPPGEARRILGNDAVIGLSTHSLEQVRIALDLPVDYIALGPVFPTNTKDGHEPVVGLQALAAARRIAGDLPIVAIGGITAQRLVSVIDAGADSAAMISALLDDPTLIAERFRFASSSIET